MACDGDGAHTLAEKIGDKEKAYFAHFHGFGAFMVRGDVRAAEGELDVMRDIAHELRQPSQIWVASIVEAMRNTFAGRLEQAEEVMEDAAELGSVAQGLDATFYYVANVQGWALRREQGRLAESRPRSRATWRNTQVSSSSAVCSPTSMPSWAARPGRVSSSIASQPTISLIYT